jgi:hypothetical protein
MVCDKDVGQVVGQGDLEGGLSLFQRQRPQSLWRGGQSCQISRQVLALWPRYAPVQ